MYAIQSLKRSIAHDATPASGSATSRISGVCSQGDRSNIAALEPAAHQQGAGILVTATEGTVGLGVVARGTNREHRVPEPLAAVPVDTGFLDELVAVGVQRLRPQVGVVARRVAAREDVVKPR